MSQRAKINTIKTFTADDHSLKLRLDLEIHLRKVTMYDQVFLGVFSFPPGNVQDFLFVWDFEMHSFENICLRLEGPFVFWSACSSLLITDAITDDWLGVDTYLLNLWSQMRQLPSLMTNCVLSNIFLDITLKSPLFIPTIITCCARMRWHP